MSSGIERIRASKYFPYAFIVYLGYVLVLFILLIPELPEIFELFSKTEISSDELYASPILPFGISVVLPLVIIYILVDYRGIFSQFNKLIVTPVKNIDRRILIYTNIFLFLQLAINLVIGIVLRVLYPNLLDFDSYTSESTFVIWIVGCAFSVSNIIVNVFIGWKWTDSGLKRPNGLYWAIGYVIYLVVIGIGVYSVQSIFPSVKGILLWPFAGIVMIGALSYFIVAFGLFLVGLDVIVSPVATGQGDAWIGFVFMAGMLFMVVSFLLLFIPMITYSTGVFLANWQTKRRLRRSKD